jgi:hypothetical protein
MSNRVRTHTAHVLAAAFEVSLGSVVEDAKRIGEWRDPADELLVWLQTRHTWNAEYAVAYLAAVRNASGDV